MQVLKRHKRMVLIAVLLVVILTVSLFIVQNTSKSSPTPTPSPVPTEISPTPTGTTSPIPTTPTPPSQTPTPTSVPTPFLYPGEVTQYQGQDLTPITDFIEDLVQHPDVSIAGTQYINQATYRLNVTGLVNNTLEYTYDDVVNNHTAYQKVVTLTCVEGWSATILWQGVLVNDLLKEAGVSPNATVVIFHASDGYTTALPLDYIVQNNITLAYKMNNVTLTAQIGWPLMLVAQNQYGYKWIMWVTEIDVSNDTNYLGYWESRGYPNNATLLSDPNNATLHSDNVSVAEAIVVSVAGTVIAAVIYTTLVKTHTKQPKFWRRQRSG
jgi:DMSO/TMAO reductase YedYZ molybdopterin-dependent catalytic subunit